jgi:hypothetical protein
LYVFFFVLQEEQNRGKPNWEHLNDELHVLITVEDTENRAKLKLQRAVDEVKRLLIPVSMTPTDSTTNNSIISGGHDSFSYKLSPFIMGVVVSKIIKKKMLLECGVKG